MSDAEQLAIIGGAHVSLKRSRARIAAITIRLNEYSKDLSELSQMVKVFTANPLQENERLRELGVPRGNNLKVQLSRARPSDIPALIDELISETESVQELQKQLDNA